QGASQDSRCQPLMLSLSDLIFFADDKGSAAATQ
ncbi:hypothetical protein Tco_1306398, partial [Tanacetum coccineum]